MKTSAVNIFNVDSSSMLYLLCMVAQCTTRQLQNAIRIVTVAPRRAKDKFKDLPSSRTVYPHVSTLGPLDVAGAAQIDGLYFQELLQCNLEMILESVEAQGNTLRFKIYWRTL